MEWELVLFFFCIALVYSTVGFGGGSSYLAVLALYPMHFLDIRSIALICNIAVVGGSSIFYANKGLLDLKRVWPLLIASIPMAFIGGLIPLHESIFFILLASLLTISAITLWFQPQAVRTPGEYRTTTTHRLRDGTMGGGIGVLSGMVGIGGGIFLSPLLHMLRWAEPKKIAAACALFILVNSFAGLAGQVLHPDLHLNAMEVLPLVVAVIAGGQIGSRLGVTWFSQTAVKRATALLVLYASARLFIKYLLQ